MKKSIAENGWRRFLKMCAQLETPEQCGSFFDYILTLEEKEAVGLRFMITMNLLEAKKPQREIAKDLNVSISKITRGSNALKIIDSELREFLEAHLD